MNGRAGGRAAGGAPGHHRLGPGAAPCSQRSPRPGENTPSFSEPNAPPTYTTRQQAHPLNTEGTYNSLPHPPTPPKNIPPQGDGPRNNRVPPDASPDNYPLPQCLSSPPCLCYMNVVNRFPPIPPSCGRLSDSPHPDYIACLDVINIHLTVHVCRLYSWVTRIIYKSQFWCWGNFDLTN